MVTYLLVSGAAVIMAIAVLTVIIALRSNELHVARSAWIAAPPELVFGHVNDFRKWEAWSPYVKRDLQMQKTYSGAAAGMGARYAWNGNSQVGEGSSTIIQSQPHERIQIELEFIRPFAGTNLAEFTFSPDGSGTTVTWSLSGKCNFMSKAVGLVLNMDRMVGGDFEEGLSNLKGVAEGSSGSSPPLATGTTAVSES